jgi:hypothetical protein
MVVTLGTSGAIPTTEPIYTAADGIISLSSAGSGVYTATLGRGAPTLVSFRVETKQGTYNASTGACGGVLTTDNVAAATPTVVFTTTNAAGAATQPATGTKLYITIVTKG